MGYLNQVLFGLWAEGTGWTLTDAARSNGLGPGYMIPLEVTVTGAGSLSSRVEMDNSLFLLLEAVVLDNKMTIDIDTS